MIKTYAAQLVGRGQVAASRPVLTRWAQQLPRPWVGALEATMFTGWVYDCLRPLAQRLEVAHPAMLQAIACAKKKKNDSLDAEKTGDLLRCDLLPRCYLAPSEIRELRRILRYRNLLLREAVRRNNKVAGLLMEVGAPYHKQRLHAKGYFYPRAGGARGDAAVGAPAADHQPQPAGAVPGARTKLVGRLAAASAAAGTSRSAGDDGGA